MPIYEYLCDSCGHQLEALQSISEPMLEHCPQCHQTSLKKIVSAAGFRLSGSGWYETDFKANNQRNLTHQPTADDSKKKVDKKEASKTETKKTSEKSSTTTQKSTD